MTMKVLYPDPGHLGKSYSYNQKCSAVRGHVQTILGKINVIVTLGGGGVRAMTLSHLTCIERP
jgi:hypothetical protein